MEIISKFFDALTIISFLIGMFGHYLSMRQYFKIKAYKEKREYKNIFIEHSGMQPQNFLNPNTDFIEYFPMTLINYKLDKSWYYILDDELKKMYHQKFRYERIFWIGFLLAFPFAFIASGGVISDAGY